MSNLLDMTFNATKVYWWKRLVNDPYRLPFLLTKFVEEWAYKSIRSPTTLKQSSLHKPKIRTQVISQLLPANPLVVVVVPVRVANTVDVGMLMRLLGRLNASTYPCQVVVIDDASPVSFQTNHEILLRNSNCLGPAASRNKGLSWALHHKADVVFMTDCDCLPERTWIEAGLVHFRENPYSHILSGNTFSLGDSWFDRYQEMNGTLNGRRFIGTQRLLYGPTCNLALRQIVFENVRFHEEFTDAACEDIHYCCQCIDSGFLILFNPKMCVQHDFGYLSWRPFHNLQRFVLQFQKYAKAEGILLKNIPDYHKRQSETEPIIASLMAL